MTGVGGAGAWGGGYGRSVAQCACLDTAGEAYLALPHPLGCGSEAGPPDGIGRPAFALPGSFEADHVDPLGEQVEVPGLAVEPPGRGADDGVCGPQERFAGGRLPGDREASRYDACRAQPGQQASVLLVLLRRAALDEHRRDSGAVDLDEQPFQATPACAFRPHVLVVEVDGDDPLDRQLREPARDDELPAWRLVAPVQPRVLADTQRLQRRADVVLVGRLHDDGRHRVHTVVAGPAAQALVDVRGKHCVKISSLKVMSRTRTRPHVPSRRVPVARRPKESP